MIWKCSKCGKVYQVTEKVAFFVSVSREAGILFGAGTDCPRCRHTDTISEDSRIDLAPGSVINFCPIV
jgi:hypothetical protein